MRFRRIALAVLGAVLTSPTWSQSYEVELLESDREWAEAAAAGDLEAVFAVWAEDAEIYAPGQPPVRGIEEARRFVERRRALPGSSISWVPAVAEVSASADLGYTRGR